MPDPTTPRFVTTAEDVHATHTVVQVTDHGTVVGRVELIRHGDHDRRGRYLVVGTQEWIRPDGLGAAASREHYNKVSDRLMDEAVAIAEREGRAVAVLTPGGQATADRLKQRGFEPLGEAWWRDRR